MAKYTITMKYIQMKQKKCNVLGIIPARLNSTRFPKKLLKKILEKSVLQRTFEKASLSFSLKKILIATESEEIFNHVHSFGGTPLMTSQSCKDGTERVIEAYNLLSKTDQYDIVVNIQGDHPCIEPTTIDKIIEALKEDKYAYMSTAITPISHKEALSPHVVKCVVDKNDHALYFSRSLIPYGKTKSFFQHIGIYAYKTEFLLQLSKLKQTPLQQAENLEQLKVLEHGFKIKVAKVEDKSFGIDIPEDIEKVEKILCQ
jgi:3-deoxy-manno-octulosonate cytidylyltransferase (CMP-KDO synthetase)